MNRITAVIGVLVAVLCVAVPALADDAGDEVPYGPGYGWMGPGMMGGYEHGMMGGYGRGYGMGPGMMGGSGMGPLAMLNLTDDQRGKINKIHDEERKQHWSVMGKMLDKQSSLRDLLAQSEPDAKKVGAVYGEMAKLHQQMLETHIEAQNKMQKLLTKEQREQLQQVQRGMWGMPGGAGPRGMMGR